MATTPLPTIIVTLKTRAVDMAQELGSLTHFLEAAQALRALNNVPPNLFQNSSRKIVALIEVARKTLVVAGVPLYLFVSCSAIMAPFKAAYVDLLHMLKEHRRNVDATLTVRVHSLLTPLRTGFTIQRKGEPSNITLVSGGNPGTWKIPPESRSQFSGPTKTPDCMPPPDAFPAPANMPPRLHKKSFPVRHRIWGQEDTPAALPRRRSQIANTDQENIPAMPQPRGLARPMSRRFGIFCTGKSSMHQPLQDRGRVRTLRPAKE
ncbi:hypothetical protein BDZ94DRAFT_1246426 [Collybia nuda]|uniref:Uncharacterized protein n=1 Tax=Collybia nuda TaxID=64659 RepID=A0A9P5YIM8_9AGAR|nr:hypothetical protein BDZ94DRAFT_1246426 [Collybia nuda]